MGFLFTTFIAGLCILIAYYIFKAQQVRILARANGCQPPRRYPHKEPFLGLDVFFQTGKALAEHRYLPEIWQRYTKLGRTFETLHFGSRLISSIEPENLKAIWVTNFADWGVQPVRLRYLNPFCGRGFITTDGPEWERSRVLLKPSFQKAVISDLSPLENSLQMLIERIPNDGSTVDLQPLFFSLVRFLSGVSAKVLRAN